MKLTQTRRFACDIRNYAQGEFFAYTHFSIVRRRGRRCRRRLVQMQYYMHARALREAISVHFNLMPPECEN